MVFSYYPGCTLKTKAKDLERYGRAAAAALDVTLEELENWQCCGAVYPLGQDEIASKLSAVRALKGSGEKGQALITLCSACHHVIKRVNHDMATNSDMRAKVNAYMGEPQKYAGETRVMHYLEMLRDEVGFDELKKRVVNPLKDKKVGAYYGCLLLRPSSEMQFDNPENPSIFENFIRALGAEAVVYSMRNECCGAYSVLENRGVVKRLCDKILTSAKEKGAEMIVTACPLCRYNLDQSAGALGMEVRYFTDILADALGVKEGG